MQVHFSVRFDEYVDQKLSSGALVFFTKRLQSFAREKPTIWVKYTSGDGSHQVLHENFPSQSLFPKSSKQIQNQDESQHQKNFFKVQWVPQLFERVEFFHINKFCKIECCGNKMPQIVKNMILSQGLELKLSLL